MSEDKRLVDPLTRHVYTGTDDGLVEVYDPGTGARGIFDETGQWLSGELTYANRQLTGWVGRAVRNRRAAHSAAANDDKKGEPHG